MKENIEMEDISLELDYDSLGILYWSRLRILMSPLTNIYCAWFFKEFSG